MIKIIFQLEYQYKTHKKSISINFLYSTYNSLLICATLIHFAKSIYPSKFRAFLKIMIPARIVPGEDYPTNPTSRTLNMDIIIVYHCSATTAMVIPITRCNICAPIMMPNWTRQVQILVVLQVPHLNYFYKHYKSIKIYISFITTYFIATKIVLFISFKIVFHSNSKDDKY